MLSKIGSDKPFLISSVDMKILPGRIGKRTHLANIGIVKGGENNEMGRIQIYPQVESNSHFFSKLRRAIFGLYCTHWKKKKPSVQILFITIDSTVSIYHSHYFIV